MIKHILYIACLLISFVTLGQNELKKNWYKGNVFYQDGDYENALFYYQKATEHAPLHFATNYNLGNTYFRAEDYEKAIEFFNKVKEIATTNSDKSWVYHNLGNTYLFNKNVDLAISSYKEALKLNPRDEETRYNLAYAQLLKKENDSQNKEEGQEKSEKNKDKKEGGGDKKDTEGEGEQNEKNNDGEDENKSPDKKEDSEQGNSKDGDEEKKDPQDSKPNYEPITKEEAQRILDAAKRKEKKIQGEINNKKKLKSGKSDKIDW